MCKQVFEIKPSLNVVELRKSYGDSCLYRQVCYYLLSLLIEFQSKKIRMITKRIGAVVRETIKRRGHFLAGARDSNIGVGVFG